MSEHSNDKHLAPRVDTLSAYVISGAVTSKRDEDAHETVSRTPAQGIQDGVDAERLGYRGVWISERLDIKLTDVILSGIAARTTRLEVGTGLMGVTARHPWMTAAFAATMQACYGPRLILGVGRGDDAYFRGTDLRMATYREMEDYITIARELWRGDTVHYDGPLGRFDAMSFAERYHGSPPPVYFGGFAQPRGARLIAEHCDGVLLVSMMTPHAVHDAVERINAACVRIGRDPAEVRKIALVVTAPELDEFETRSLAHGRMVTYLTYPGYGDMLAEVNGWDAKVVHDVREHPLLSGLKEIPDRSFQRHQMLEAASRIPDAHMQECSAIGTVDECVASLQRFIDAGADEVATYGSTPLQNAKLVAAWREHEAARAV